VSFPLKRWIDDHHGVRHDLSRSGMPKGLPKVAGALRRPERPDPEALRRELARIHRVPPSTLFLTHGATEATTLVLFYLARTLRHGSRPLRCAVARPEYPPIPDTATYAGFRVVGDRRPAEVAALSQPNNPTGRLWTPEEVEERAMGRRAVLIDETFREFTRAPTNAGRSDPRIWVVGSFTKLYGGDDLRVGYIIPPGDAAEEFDRFHGLLLDELPPASVAGARALVRDRPTILPDMRARIRRNAAVLEEHLPGLAPDGAPVVFDRPRRRPTDGLGRAALRAGVLVAPGHFFHDRSGVRLGITRPTFPEDLAAYLTVRARWDRPGSRS
jgi:histidinol-phosphate/aromatic aminotransferase/cobyric acid decarboxylase-like protein